MRLAVNRIDLELSARTVLVDNAPGIPWLSRAVNLDHHRGHRTPAELMGETATNIVLNALQAGFPLRDFRQVAIRHYDTDGCLAAWAVLHPEEALEHRAELLAAARYGDFYEGSARESSARHGIIISSVLQDYFMERPNTGVSTGDLFERAFEILPTLLREPESHAPLWTGWLHQFERGCESIELASPGVHTEFVRIVEFPPGIEVCLGSLASGLATPIIGSAIPTEQGYLYRIFLRPRFAWGYSPDAVGPVPLQSLRGARHVLQRAENAVGGNTCWTHGVSDGNVWSLGSPTPSRLDPSTLEIELREWARSAVARRDSRITTS